MKNISFKSLLPHIVAVVVFLLASIFFTKPALEGKVVSQHDVQQWRAMAQQSFEYKEKHGHFPRWTNSMFSGMPAYQIVLDNQKDIGVHVFHFNNIVSLGLPKPVYYLFLACLGFYFLAVVLKVNPWLSMVGAIAYGYCSYNPTIIVAGHDTKLLAMCYAPAILASLILIFDKRYYIGTAALVLTISCQLMQGHHQIVYYTILMILCLSVAFIIRCIRAKEYRHMMISGGVALVIAIICALTVSNSLLPTYEYGLETMRGGQSMLTQADSTNKTKGGLDKDYAFHWSYGKAETLTLLVPNAFGGGSSTSLGEQSKVIEVLQENGNIPPDFANQLLQGSRAYWGPQPPPSEAVYLGGLICLLFLFGAILGKSRHKWWIIAITIISLVLAWGNNMQAVNYFLFDHMPMYNKFRAPSMGLVMAQLSIPLLAIIFLQEFIYNTPKEELKALTKKCLYITGALVVVLLGAYFMADYKNEATNEFRKSVSAAMQGSNEDFVRSYFAALTKDRASLFFSDLIRTLAFIAAGVGLLVLYSRKVLSPIIVSVAFILITAIDLMGIATRYLSEENFVEPTDYEVAYAPSNGDLAVKRDTSYYRVLNLAFKDPGSGQYYADLGTSFNDAIASYKHKTIGGYHPAKLSLYQDLISGQIMKNIQAWAGNPMATDSFPVLNMLNMKYVILPDQQNPLQTQAVTNNYALGDAWLVREVRFVNTADEEMKALDNFNPRITAFANAAFRNAVPVQPGVDSLASIRLINNDNDIITYDYNSYTNQFAVFSQVYFSHGWNAYIDGKPVEHIRVNYALRGLAVPAGKHSIVFKFEPKLVALGETLAFWSGIISVLIVLFCLFMEFRRWKSNKI